MNIRVLLFNYAEAPGPGLASTTEFTADFFRHAGIQLHWADAYAGYDQLYKEPGRGVVEVGCFAHARRKFFEARSGNLPCVGPALAYIGLLYRIERKAREWTSAERLELRERCAAPVLVELRAYWERAQAAVLPKSPDGMAIASTLSNWRALSRYATDDDLAIDNNGAERRLRGVAVGRRHWMLFGSDRTN